MIGPAERGSASGANASRQHTPREEGPDALGTQRFAVEEALRQVATEVRQPPRLRPRLDPLAIVTTPRAWPIASNASA